MLLSIGASEATSVSQKLLDRDILSFNKQLAIQCLGLFIFCVRALLRQGKCTN